ncbi:hypothetical protein GQ607_010346 [Colletotrichum asianum]|uniref:Uncharacterized protein n=1 Tax=Colletotrichum asianum TaxID=702518 RepID=A0A8H3W710_9PEZI|nr:hypothetical protein GQ607_010346 [Colletotrichum asianum]
MSAMYPASTNTRRQYSFLVPLLVACVVLHKAFLYPRTANASHLQEYGSRGDGKVGKCMQNSSPPCHRGDRIHSHALHHSSLQSFPPLHHACLPKAPSTALPCLHTTTTTATTTLPRMHPAEPGAALHSYGVTAVDAPLQTALLSPARPLQRPAHHRSVGLPSLFAGKCAHPWALCAGLAGCHVCTAYTGCACCRRSAHLPPRRARDSPSSSRPPIHHPRLRSISAHPEPQNLHLLAGNSLAVSVAQGTRHRHHRPGRFRYRLGVPPFLLIMDPSSNVPSFPTSIVHACQQYLILLPCVAPTHVVYMSCAAPRCSAASPSASVGWPFQRRPPSVTDVHLASCTKPPHAQSTLSGQSLLATPSVCMESSGFLCWDTPTNLHWRAARINDRHQKS